MGDVSGRIGEHPAGIGIEQDDVAEGDPAVVQDLEDVPGELGVERVANLEWLDPANSSAKDWHRFDKALCAKFIGGGVEAQDPLGDRRVFEEMPRRIRERIAGHRIPRDERNLPARFRRSLQLPDEGEHAGRDERKTTRERRQAAPGPPTQPLLLGLAPATIRTAAPPSVVVLYQIAAALLFSVRSNQPRRDRTGLVTAKRTQRIRQSPGR